MLYGLPTLSAAADRMTTLSPPTARVPAGAWLLLVLGTVGFAALWVLFAVGSGHQLGWLALVGALDVAWMLRLGRWPAGMLRVVAATVATATIVVLANWWIIASHLGAVLGFSPWESAQRLGFNHAWTLVQIANGVGDLVFAALALALAAFASR